MTYNTELENCLLEIARKYAPQLVPATGYAPGDLGDSLAEFTGRLRKQGVLIVIGDRFGHTDETITDAARDCVALYRRLYQYLAARLFPFTYAGTETRAVLCQEVDFVVLGLCAPAGPIVDAVESVVVPFIIQNHTPALPDRAVLKRLAGRLLLFLETEPVDADMVDEIADIIEALCVMALRPLPYLPGHAARPPRTLPEFDREATPKGPIPDPQLIGDFDPETGAAPTRNDNAMVGPIPHWS